MKDKNTFKRSKESNFISVEKRFDRPVAGKLFTQSHANKECNWVFPLGSHKDQRKNIFAFAFALI